MITYSKEEILSQWYLVETHSNGNIFRYPYADESAIDTYLGDLKTLLQTRLTFHTQKVNDLTSDIASIDTLLNP